MTRQVAHWLILTILIFVLYTTGALSLNQYVHGNVCPKLIGVPACYIIFLCAVISLISHLNISFFKDTSYFTGIGIITIISIIAVATEATGRISGPTLGDGTPMAYYALGISLVLILLKVLENKKS